MTEGVASRKHKWTGKRRQRRTKKEWFVFVDVPCMMSCKELADDGRRASIARATAADADRAG